MATNDKLQIFPSRANAVLMKQRILAAKRGAGLLKRKRDAIEMKLRELKQEMGDKDDEMVGMMRTAIFSVAKANLLGTDFKPVLVADSPVATANLRKRTIKIVGVTLNYFELEATEGGNFPTTGLSCGGQQVKRVRQLFLDALREIIEVASFMYMQRMLKEAVHQTSMRVNALDHVVIPKLVNTHTYIIGELEELEREDFYRLKRSQAKQLQAKIAFTELIKTRNMTPEQMAEYVKRGKPTHPAADTHFDVTAFENQSMEARLRQAFLKGKQKEDPLTLGSEKRKSKLMNFLSSIAVLREPRASRASFISLANFAKTRHLSTSSDEDSVDYKEREKNKNKL